MVATLVALLFSSFVNIRQTAEIITSISLIAISGDRHREYFFGEFWNQIKSIFSFESS